MAKGVGQFYWYGRTVRGIRPDPLGSGLNSLGNCLGLLGFGSDKSGKTAGKYGCVLETQIGFSREEKDDF